MVDVSSKSRAWKRLSRSRSAWIGTAIVLVLVLMALAADWVSPYGPQERATIGRHAAPSAEHWLGTDQDGFDVWARIIYGSRLSLAAGVVSMALAIAVGATAGIVAGYFGGWVDAVTMRAIDVMLSLPGILIAILVVMASSRTSWTPIMIAVGVINIPIFCRQVRATVLTIRQLDYVTASRAFGASPPHILLKVMLPGVVSPILVLATLGLGTAVLEVAGLSFLGIAGQPDDAEWGSMLAAAKEHLATSLWPVIAPGAAITLCVLGFNLLGDGLRDALDPHLAGRD